MGGRGMTCRSIQLVPLLPLLLLVLPVLWVQLNLLRQWHLSGQWSRLSLWLLLLLSVLLARWLLSDQVVPLGLSVRLDR